MATSRFFVAAMKRYAPRHIRRTLSKYETKEVQLTLGERVELVMVEVGDAYSLLDRMIEQEGRLHRVERFPYWAELWPASIALGRWMVQAKLPVPTGWVRELGCGLGLVGIGLAKLGWKIEATDFVEDALIFSAHNARLNRVETRHRVAYLDWSKPVGSPLDCLIGSDVVYEKKNHPYLGRVLRKLLRPGGTFYMSDPQRSSARDFVEMLVVQGFDHRVETWAERWNSLEHRVDIHIFTKP